MISRSKRARLFYLAILIAFTLGLIGPAALAGAAQHTKAHPLLVQLAAEDPHQEVGVIVQAAGEVGSAKQQAIALGGEITKDLSIIHAFVADMQADSAIELATSPTVRWVSLDSAVRSAAVSRQTLTDNFNSVSYDNNDGTQRWASPWMEEDALGSGASGGNVWITNDGLRLSNASSAATAQSVTREADLGHALTEPSLGFSFSLGSGVQTTDKVMLEISKDGGATYKSIITFTSYKGGTTGTSYANIANYVSSHTRIRFRVLAGYNRSDAYFSIDSIEIGYDANPLSSGPAYNTYLDTLGVRQVWDMGYRGQGIGVAIIDSGVNKETDFGRRIKKQISFNPNSNTVNDTSGHGTHVAGIVGGEDLNLAGRFTGIAPGVNLISLKISDETGMAYESDLVEALQWVYDNKKQFNIRVINLSLNSTAEQSYHTSPVDAAAEILWFNGVVVVASAGNKGPGGDYNTANAAPANDPFIITVGASQENYTASLADDTVTPFSAFGTTTNGFIKPDIIAPGKDIISALSSRSEWYANNTQRVVQEEYFRLSGTSMAAPMVTGAVALLLQDEPNLTPDQVKYRLLNASNTILGSSSDIDPATGQVRTYPYLNVYKAVTGTSTQSANTGLTASQLLWTGTEPITWGSVAWNSVAWNSVAWNSVAWNSVAWNSVAWNSDYWEP